jgi:hypothetical protein
MTKSVLIGLLDDAEPPVPPAAGMWPRVITEAGYDEFQEATLPGGASSWKGGTVQAVQRRKGEIR